MKLIRVEPEFMATSDSKAKDLMALCHCLCHVGGLERTDSLHSTLLLMAWLWVV